MKIRDWLRTWNFPNLLALELSINFIKFENFDLEWISTMYPNLRFLTLKNFQFESLSNSECMSKLEELCLNYNKLEWTVGGSWSAFASLRSLSISCSSKLKIEPGIFDGLVNLRTLDLNYNYFKLTSGLLNRLESLERLRLENNRFDSIDRDVFLGLTNLTTLSLADNYLRNLDPNVFAHLPNLTELDLSCNHSMLIDQSIFSYLKRLRTLKLNLSNMRENLKEDGGVFASLSCLEVLSLRTNSLEMINERTFEGLDQLRELDLSQNFNVKVSASVISSLKRLQKLYFKYNHYKSIRELVKKFPNIDFIF